jgi:hypothetical protein
VAGRRRADIQVTRSLQSLTNLRESNSPRDHRADKGLFTKFF